MRKFSVATAMLGLVVLNAPAHATGLLTCDTEAGTEWQTVEALEQALLADGWQEVRRIKEDGGCYEAYGTTPEGDRVEAYFHPVSLEKLLVARRGQILFRADEQ